MTTHTETHTPGPWTVHTLANGQHTVCGPIATAGYEAAVAQIPSEPTIFDAATRATNAALIASAPETARKLAVLLAAADALVNAYYKWDGTVAAEDIRPLRAAIEDCKQVAS